MKARLNFWSGIEMLKKTSDGWGIKRVLKPLYLPYLLKLKFFMLNKNFKLKGKSTMLSAVQALDEIGLFYWIEFGTLLGIIRDGKLIDHDTDLDFGVLLEDFTPLIEETLVKQGFRKIHRIDVDEGRYGLEESYELNGVTLDLFFFTKVEGGMHCHLFPNSPEGPRAVRECFTRVIEFDKITWQGCVLNIPADPAQRLTDTYGDYLIPRKDWHTPTSALNSRIISRSCNEAYY